MRSFAFFLLLAVTVPVQAEYVIMGVFTSTQQAYSICKDHRNHPATNEECSAHSNTLDGTIDACPSQHIIYHWGDDGTNGVPRIWPDLYAFISTENCGGTCPTGWTEQPTGECLQNQQCPVGDEQRFHGDAGEPIPDTVCSNGCWYEVKYVDVPVTFNMQGTAWSGNYVSTGNSCAPGGGPGGPPDDPPLNCISDNYGNTFCAGVGPDNAPPNCMENAAGDQACIDAYDPMNCGYINGEKVCFDDYPDSGECYFIPGGSYICFPGSEEPASPPYPDTGTPGEPATPDVQMVSGDPAGAPGPIDYFNSDTVNESSGEGGAPGPTSDVTPPDDPTKIDGPLKIDESGTPSGPSSTGYNSYLDTTGIGQLESDINAIGSGSLNPIPDVPTSFSDLENILPASGSCSDPSITFFGHVMTIPIVSKGDGFRDIIGWAFYAFTALFLFWTVMSLPQKVR